MTTTGRSERFTFFTVLAGLFIGACVLGAFIDLVFGSPREDWGAIVLLGAAAGLVGAGLYVFRSASPWLAGH